MMPARRLAVMTLAVFAVISEKNAQPERDTLAAWLGGEVHGVGTSGARKKTSATVKRELYGKMPDGTQVDKFTLSSGSIQATIITYGGIVSSLLIPDREGKMADIVLGYDSLQGYLASDQYFGAIIGRYANRIAHARFILDGREYPLIKNDGDNSIHGGPHGFDTVLWSATQIQNGVELTYVSADGEQGYPGTIVAVVRYTLDSDCLRIEYAATTDKNTIINLTNHSYFNLAGAGHGDVLHHQIQINSSRFTPVDSALIPTGQIAAVESTPFDFREPRDIGARINANSEQLQRANGYDHNWVLDSANGDVSQAAEVFEPSRGRVLRVFTDQPGLQFYSGNFLDGSIKGKDGHVYQKHSGFCLETQHFPDSPNHPNFPSTVLRPGERYHSITIFQFSKR